MEKLRVSVTKNDIKCGVPGSLHLCPVARAVRRSGKSRISVDGSSIQIRNKFYDVPRKVSRFVDRFDHGQTVRPITFVATRFTY